MTLCPASLLWGHTIFLSYGYCNTTAPSQIFSNCIQSLYEVKWKKNFSLSLVITEINVLCPLKVKSFELLSYTAMVADCRSKMGWVSGEKSQNLIMFSREKWKWNFPSDSPSSSANVSPPSMPVSWITRHHSSPPPSSSSIGLAGRKHNHSHHAISMNIYILCFAF